LCGEAIRNRAARLALTLTLLVAWSGSALMVYVAERDAAHSNAAYTSSMLRDGYTTLLIKQSDSAPEKLTWANCRSLRHDSGVRAVVGLREPVSLRLWGAGGPEVAVREAMGDVADFLAMTSPSRSRSWSSPSLIFDVDALGARPADGTESDFVTRVVQKSGDADIRTAITENLTSFGGGFSGNAIMLAPPGGEISTCVALTDVDKRDGVATIASGLFPVGAGFGQQWALTNAERFDSPRDQYEARASRWYWLGAVALIVIAWTFSLWILRSDLAVFSVAGLGTRQILGMVTAEMLVVVLGASLITLGFATFDWYSHAESRDAVETGIREVARVAAAGFGVCTAVSAAAAAQISRRTLDALKDR
jgi:hypothetical protein